MSENFVIKIGSVPHREELVAEIYYNYEQWVEISQEQEPLIIRFYSPLVGKCWEFSLDEALEVLEKAKKKLLGLGGRRS